MGRKCRRKLGIGGKFMIDIFLIPFYAFKWVFSLAFWYYGLYFLMNTETYENASDKLKERWNELRQK
jgi:predicted membrane protein